MINEEQIEKTEIEKDKSFVSKIANKFTPKDLIRESRKESSALKRWSFACNILSLLAAVYYIYYITMDYSGYKKAIPLFIGVVVLIAVELGKRYFSIITFEYYYAAMKKWIMLAFPVLVLSAISITISSLGGDKFVKEESAPIQLVRNLKTDTLKSEIIALRSEVALQKKQTWRGKIVTDSRKLIKEYEARISKKEDQITSIEKEDKLSNKGLAEKRDNRLQDWGLIFGLFVGSMDVLLIILLGRAEFLEHRAQLYLKEKGVNFSKANFKGMNLENVFGLNKSNQIGFKLPESKKTTPTHARANTRTHSPARTGAHTRAYNARTRIRTHAHTHEGKCKNCKTPFEPKSKRNKYCSKECREEFQGIKQNA